jgi:hypothetical protein
MYRLIPILYILSLGGLFAQETTTLTIEFEVDQGAANRFIYADYASPSFPKEFSGTVGSYTYHLMLDRPALEFLPGIMRMQAGLTAETSIGNFEWTITPSIVIDEYSLSLLDIKASLENFANYVNTYLTDAPSWLRDVIIQHFAPIELTTYPGKILDEINSQVPTFVDLEVLNVTPGPLVALDGTLQFQLGIEVRSAPAHFEAYTYDNLYLKLTTTVEITVRKVQVYNIQGHPDFESEDPVTISKEVGFYVWNLPPGLDPAARLARFVLDSPYNTYVRIFQCTLLEGETWVFQPLEQSIN